MGWRVTFQVAGDMNEGGWVQVELLMMFCRPQLVCLVWELVQGYRGPEECGPLSSLITWQFHVAVEADIVWAHGPYRLGRYL